MITIARNPHQADALNRLTYSAPRKYLSRVIQGIWPDVARQRFKNQHIPGAAFKKVADVVGWMGAVQAQDYPGSLWAVGLRMQNAIEADIEQAIVDGTIVRSWPMRGTLHFVAAPDIRWMLKLLAPRVIVRSTPRYRQLELDGTALLKCRGVLTRALQGKKLLTRHELGAKLERSGVATRGQRLIHIIGRAAMEGLICHGARRGNLPLLCWTNGYRLPNS